LLPSVRDLDMSTPRHWRIELGHDRWAKFTYARPAGGALRLLGSISRGMQVGALAQTQDGQYVQVNGDHVTSLPGGQVRRALALLKEAAPRCSPTRSPPPERAVAVTVKRRRTIVRPDPSNADPQRHDT